MCISDIDGVFITHIHGDHVQEATVRSLVKEHIPIYCHPQIEHHLLKKYHSVAIASHEKLLKPVTTSEVELNTLRVTAFEVPHDSDGGCFGYSVYCDEGGKTKKVSVSTDMACATESAIGHIANSDVIVIESNYDEVMLDRSGRPEWLQRRIRENGHLSNDQCAEALLQIIAQSDIPPLHLALAHVSQQCNTNAKAHNCTNLALKERGVRGIDIHETYPDKSGCIMVV